MNRTMLSRLLAILLASLMALGNLGAAAEGAGSAMGDKTAAPTELTEDNRETTVTLSLPSEEYRNKVDIVFVMDNSTSTELKQAAFSDEVKAMFQSVTARNPNIDLKVGVIKFRGYATDMLGSGLTPYNSGSEARILAAIDNNDVPGRGTNIHGGLVMADKLLEADSGVDNANKYVVLLTDGKTYIWNNDADEPTTTYTQYYQHYAMKGNGIPTISQSAGAYDKAAYPVLVGNQKLFWFDDYADLYAQNNENLSSTSTKYDYPARYATNNGVPTGTYAKRATTNGSTLFKNKDYQYYWEYMPSADWSNMVWLEANPYEVIQNSDGTYTFDTNSPNPDYYMILPDHLQKAEYLTGHLWTDMMKKYKCGAVIYQDWKSGSGLSVAKSFCAWLINESHYGADVTNAAQVEKLFDDIDDSISYLVDHGTVTDQIKDDFTLKENGNDTFTVTVGGVKQNATKTGNNSWVFGTSAAGKYPYEITYNPSTKTIYWTINVPIEVANKVKLSYGLILREDAETGRYDTNESAVLRYTSTDGKDGSFPFPFPKVNYKKAAPPAPTPTPSQDDIDKLPKTGDRTPVALAVMVLVLSVSALLLINKRKR